MRIAARAGRIHAIEHLSWSNSGQGRWVADPTGPTNGLYDIPNVRVDQETVSTFTAVARAFRAPDHPPGVYALEGMVDEFAHAIGMDPLDVRRLNDRHPVRRLEWPIGANRIGWAKNRRKVPGSDAGPVKRGLGCAGGIWYQKGGGSWRVDVSVARDGSVVASNGAQGFFRMIQR